MKFINKLILGSTILLMTLSCNESSEPTFANACDELDAVDLEMLQKLEKIRIQYKGDPEFLKRFNDAHVMWIQYKDRHVRALYPGKKENYKEEYGMDYNNCKCKEWSRLTKLRLIDLDKWIDNEDDIDNCPSSIK